MLQLSLRGFVGVAHSLIGSGQQQATRNHVTEIWVCATLEMISRQLLLEQQTPKT